MAEPLAHLGEGARAREVPALAREPVARRAALLCRHDLDPLCVRELVVERHHLAVDLRAAAAVAEVGVHVVGEIDRRRARGQVDHLALRREDIDGVIEQAVAPVVLRLAAEHLLLPGEHLAQPGDLGVELLVRLRALFLVAPMRGHAVLGMLVHLVGADLHLERLALRAHHRRMQRLVVVRFRARDVVVELALYRGPQVVHHAEHRVALADVLHDHAHRADVVELLERHALAAHLPPDRIDMLRPPLDRARLDARPGELLAQGGDEALDVGLAVETPLVQELRDLLVDLGLVVAERVVLQLPLHLRDAEPVGERREELQRLAPRGAANRVVGLGDAAQVHHALGELDQHHAHVLGDGEEHLAQLLHVHAGGVEGLDPPGTRQALQQRGELGAEVGLHRVEVELGLGDRLAHDRRGHRLGVRALDEQQAGDGEAALERFGAADGLRGALRELKGAHGKRRERVPEGIEELSLEAVGLGGGGGGEQGCGSQERRGGFYLPDPILARNA